MFLGKQQLLLFLRAALSVAKTRQYASTEESIPTTTRATPISLALWAAPLPKVLLSVQLVSRRGDNDNVGA